MNEFDHGILVVPKQPARMVWKIQAWTGIWAWIFQAFLTAT